MRNADKLRRKTAQFIRPRYCVWENVPRSFSCGDLPGEDFRILLEEFVRVNFDTLSVPRPDAGKWKPAGRILLGDSFSLAWHCVNAQLCGASHNCVVIPCVEFVMHGIALVLRESRRRQGWKVIIIFLFTAGEKVRSADRHHSPIFYEKNWRLYDTERIY